VVRAFQQFEAVSNNRDTAVFNIERNIMYLIVLVIMIQRLFKCHNKLVLKYTILNFLQQLRERERELKKEGNK